MLKGFAYLDVRPLEVNLGSVREHLSRPRQAWGGCTSREFMMNAGRESCSGCLLIVSRYNPAFDKLVVTYRP